MLVSALLWHSYGPSCYRFILSEGLLSLPSIRTLQKLSGNLSLGTSRDETLAYLQSRAKNLNIFERCCSLVIDEITYTKVFSIQTVYGISSSKLQTTFIEAMKLAEESWIQYYGLLI